jgi:hypothetical protein
VHVFSEAFRTQRLKVLFNKNNNFENFNFITEPGLQDRLFKDQKSQFEYILVEAKCWYILRPFGIMYGRMLQLVVLWYIFSLFGMFGPRKIWQPCAEPSPSDCFYA